MSSVPVRDPPCPSPVAGVVGDAGVVPPGRGVVGVVRGTVCCGVAGSRGTTPPPSLSGTRSGVTSVVTVRVSVAGRSSGSSPP
ncbi:hypothetical protein CXF43_09910, partial [Corynebacterium bovis]